MRDLPNFDSRIVNTPRGPVDVAAVESDGFTDPHAGGGQQPDQGLVRGRRQLMSAGRAPGQQRVDVVGAVDERLDAIARCRNQPGGGTSVSGSMPAMCRAKPRAIVIRRAGLLLAGSTSGA